MYEAKSVCRFDPEMFRRQILFFIIGLKALFSKYNKESRTFEKDETVLRLMLSSQWTDLNAVLNEIENDNTKIISQHKFLLKTRGVKEWSTTLEEKFIVQNKNYYSYPLNDLVYSDEIDNDTFSETLLDIAQDISVDVHMVIFRNLSRQKGLKNTIQDLVKERFTDKNDHRGLHSIMKKNQHMYSL